MGKIILVTGGARSGKSSFAEKLLRESAKSVLYIATSIPFDNEMKDRVKKHREQRPDCWDTLEAYCNLDIKINKVFKNQEGILLDCITIMITNILFDNPDIDWDTCHMETVNKSQKRVELEIEKLITLCRELDVTTILVTNELGLGIVPENRLARIFRDIAGKVNQQIASVADEVYFVISGIPMKIK